MLGLKLCVLWVMSSLMRHLNGGFGLVCALYSGVVVVAA